MADRSPRTTKQPAQRGLRAPARPLPPQHVLSLFCSLIFCAACLFSWQAAAQQPTPKSADVHFEQGMRMLKQRNWRAAADEFRMAIKIDPQRAQAHDGLGLALARQGKPQEAVAEYHRSLEIDPAYAEVHYHLGMALGEGGDPQQAMTDGTSCSTGGQCCGGSCYNGYCASCVPIRGSCSAGHCCSSNCSGGYGT
jgi:cytochrome c-type biogenesis protein CcmH/NrfG